MLDAEQLKRIVPTVTSWNELARRVGLIGSGQRVVILRREVEALGLSIDHFRKWRKTADEILVDGGPKTSLKRALLEVGRTYECEECGQTGMWQGKPLTLHIDHKNGNRTDHRAENLRFLCPNCHTQTPTYGGRNVRRNTGESSSG